MIAPLLLAAVTAAVAANPQPSSGFSPQPQAGGYAVTMAAVFVRRTPSLPGPVIDEEKANTLYKVIGCRDGWCAIDLGSRGGVGYLTADVLQGVPSPP